MSVPVADLAYFDPARGWTIEPLEYEAIIARHAEDGSGLRASFRVE